jgi:hypothetical protein
MWRCAERREAAVRQLSALPSNGGEGGEGLPARMSVSPEGIGQEAVSRLGTTGVAAFPTHAIKPSPLLTRTGIAVAVKPQLSSLPPKHQPPLVLTSTGTPPLTKSLQPLPAKPAAGEPEAFPSLPLNVSPVKSSGLGPLPPVGGRRHTASSV